MPMTSPRSSTQTPGTGTGSLCGAGAGIRLPSSPLLSNKPLQRRPFHQDFLFFLGVREGGIDLRSLRQRHKPKVSFPNVTTSTNNNNKKN